MVTALACTVELWMHLGRRLGRIAKLTRTREVCVLNANM